MASRKAAFKDDETSNKRQRVATSDSPNESTAASFESLNGDCVLQILSFLPVDDLNTFGTVSRCYRTIRNHVSLDQARTATITCSQANRSTDDFLRTVLTSASFVLSARYTTLKVLGLETLASGPFARPYGRIQSLSNVTKLELALNPNEQGDNQSIDETILQILPAYLPNLNELVLNGAKISNSNASNRFYRGFSQLTRVSKIGSGVQFNNLIGWDFRDMPRLTDLVLDDCFFVHKCAAILGGNEAFQLMVLAQFSDDRPASAYVLRCCRQLQRLSIKGATWSVPNENGFSHRPNPIPQEMLIKMVRNHPTLCWLRSDLSEENVAMLQQERPEITFVSE